MATRHENGDITLHAKTHNQAKSEAHADGKSRRADDAHRTTRAGTARQRASAKRAADDELYKGRVQKRESAEAAKAAAIAEAAAAAAAAAAVAADEVIDADAAMQAAPPERHGARVDEPGKRQAVASEETAEPSALSEQSEKDESHEASEESKIDSTAGEAADVVMDQATPRRCGIRTGVVEGKRRVVTEDTAAVAETEAEAEEEKAVAEVGRSRRKMSAAMAMTTAAAMATARGTLGESSARRKQATATGKGVTRAVERCADSPVRYMQKIYEQMTRGERMLLATWK